MYMYIEFKKLSFCNFLSYGASGAELDFKNGLNIIKAPNGSGKSTILDALTFVLFGKPYRDIKLAELINTQNQKGLEVEVDFKIGKDNYNIKRGLKPALFEIKKNGNDIDLLSSKKLNQDEIDKLLGINLRLFKNIVAVAVTNNKPFLSLSIGDKRALCENIFNIDVLGVMCKDVKKRKHSATTEFEIKQTESTGVTRSIEDNQRYLSNLQEYIKSFNQVKDSNIKRIQSSIEDFQNRISKCESNLKIANDSIIELTNELGDKPDNQIGAQLNLEIGKIFSVIERTETTLEKLKKSPMCPVCHSPLDEGHAKKHIDEMIAEKTELENTKLPLLQAQYQEYSDALDKYNKKLEFIRTVKDKARAVETTKDNLLIELNKAQTALETETEKTCPADLSTYEVKLNELSTQLELLQTSLMDLQESIAIDTELINILGDDGIKTYFFKKLTGILNKSVNEYLTKFELKNVQLEFDESMQESLIKDMVPRSYNSFSSGEKTRIDISILLSFFDISRLISNWSCNIFFIDELLDSNVDQSGIDQFISTLYNMVTENKKKMGIYIISHKTAEIKVQLSSIVNIKKIHDFSVLEVQNG